MKRLLFLFVLSVCCSSCITLYFHKNFTYQCDDRNTGIEKHLRLAGYFVHKGKKNVGLIFLYRDGSIAQSHVGYSTIEAAEKDITQDRGCPGCAFSWGQCKVVGDTLYSQVMYQAEAGRYRIDIDTFLVHSDTSIEEIWDYDGMHKKNFLFHPSAIRPDSSNAPVRSQNWYWTKAYKDSVYYARRHKHKLRQ